MTLDLSDGVITFDGNINSDDMGINVSSGSGDSGGPLFIYESGEYLIAGLTHGGRVIGKMGF